MEINTMRIPVNFKAWFLDDEKKKQAKNKRPKVKNKTANTRAKQTSAVQGCNQNGVALLSPFYFITFSRKLIFIFKQNFIKK